MAGDTLALAALVRKRAELAGDIENAHAALKRMVGQLEHLDATLRLFDPDIRTESIRPKAFRPPADWASRGEMTRIALGVLRCAAEPLTTRDIAWQLLAERGMDNDDDRLVRTMTKRVGVALRRQRETGVVRSGQGPGQYMLWALAKG